MWKRISHSARILLIFSSHPSLSSFALDGMYVRTELMNVSFCWPANTCVLVGERHLWFPPYFTGSAQYVLFILVGMFTRWEVSDCTTTVLLGIASRISSKQHTTSLCGSYLAFSPNILLKSKWCNCRLVLTVQNLGRIHVLFYQILFESNNLLKKNDKL